MPKASILANPRRIREESEKSPKNNKEHANYWGSGCTL